MKLANEKVNPYKSPQNAADGETRGLRVSLMYVLALLLTAGLPILIFFANRQAIVLFRDFDVELPMVTRMCLSWMFLLLTIVLFVSTFAKEFIVPHRAARPLNVLACLAAIALGLAYGFFVSMPLITLIENLA